MQNQESEDGELIGINGLRTSDITIETTGTVKLSATDTSQSSYMNVGIFATGTRKGQMPPVTSDNPADAPYIDEDGYRMSDDNITTITGNIVDISITNKNGMAVGILAQKSDKVYVNLNSPNLGFLIGYRGETLYALQNILTAVAGRDIDNRVRVILDIEGYKAKREKTLEELAEKVAKTVIRTGKSVKLEPMQAYERKIIHSELQGNSKVETNSIGEEPYRRIVVSLKK